MLPVTAPTATNSATPRTAAAVSTPRFRLANFRSRYDADGGIASTGSSAR